MKSEKRHPEFTYPVVDPDKETEKYLREGTRLKLYRKTMRLRQNEVAKSFDTEQGNYSRMEKGRLNPSWRVDAMKKRFCAWRIAEINRLQKQIDYLNSIS